MRRWLAGLAASVTILASPMVVPNAFAIDAPLSEPDYAAATRAPVVDSVNDRWVVKVSFGPLTQLRQLVDDTFAQGATGPVLVPQLIRRQIQIGKWVGDTCTEQTRPGSRTWQFVGPWGNQLERQGNWNSIRREQPIQLAPPATAGGSVFAAGDIICVTQSITWKAGTRNQQVTRTTGSLPGIAPSPLSTIYVSGMTYQDSLPAPALSAVDALQQMTVTFGPLTQTRNALVRRGYANPTIRSRSIVIGRVTEGRCVDITPPGGALGGTVEFAGSWAREFQQSTAWNKAASGGVRLRTSGQGPVFSVGDTPCAFQKVVWSDERLSGRVTFESAFGASPNAIPPLEISVTPEPLLPDGVEVVLPDFDDFSPDDEDSPAGVLGVQFTLDDIRNGVTADYISGQLGRIQGLLTVLGSAGGASPGASNTQREAAEAIAGARATLEGAALVVVESQSSGALTSGDATQSLNQINSQLVQVQNLANQAPIRLAGGVVAQGQLAQAVGFDALQSPVSGLNGAGTIGALSLDVKAPKQATRGGGVSVSVKVRPSSARGAIRLALVNKSGSVVKVFSLKRATLKKGQAKARLTIPRTAARGAYSIVASYVPATRGQTGVTVLKSIRLR